MSKRNNIEDFFNNSLDGFNEQPSDQVWLGVEEMLEVKVPFWKTWKFWGWFSGIAFLLVGLVSYHMIINQRMTTLTTQNTILLEQNQLLTQEITQTQFILKETKVKKQKAEELLNIVKDTNTSETKINRNTSDGKNAKEQFYFISELAKERSDFSISSWIDKRQNANISTFAEANRIREERAMNDLWQKKLEEANQALGMDVQSNKTKDLAPISVESEDVLVDQAWKNKNSLKTLNGISQYQYALSNPKGYHQTNVALIKASYIPPVNIKLTKPDFTPSLRLGLTGSAFSSISNIPNSIHVAYNSGLTLQWQAFRNFGFTGSLRYNELAYGISLSDANQEILERYPNTENISVAVNNITAIHHYLDLPVGIIWKIPIGKKGNRIYANPSIAWQFYLPQTFLYNTFENDLIRTQHDRLYAYFGSATINIGYEQKIRNNLRLQMGVWAENSFVEYGIDNRSGTNIGASATLIFGK
ncbi:MAG: hypothetical protein AAF806_13495 [Bacteroidota bacterium]